jgi:proteasome lid subunit RPN8/RPN11
MIAISEARQEQISAQVRREYPHEACGILAGTDGVISRVYPMKNLSDTPRTFYCLDPAEQLKVFKDMRQRGLEMLAHYHSHVDSRAYPSERDIKLAFYPESLMVIVSVTSESAGALMGFRVVDGRVKEEELAVDLPE